MAHATDHHAHPGHGHSGPFPAPARRWPTAVGALAAATLAVTGVDRDAIVLVLVIAAGCYVAAAASSRPWMSWGWIPLATALTVLAAVGDLDPLAVNLAAVIALVVVGLFRRAARPHLARQTAGLLGYGTAAVLAALAGPAAGLALAGVALMLHGAWDLWHLARHRDDVSPSLAEACVALDVPLGVVATVAALLV